MCFQGGGDKAAFCGGGWENEFRGEENTGGVKKNVQNSIEGGPCGVFGEGVEKKEVR